MGNSTRAAILVWMTELALGRDAMVQRGRRLEYFTIVWNCLEGLVAVLAGAFAGSISLIGFGVDSFIEVTSGGALLWRLSLTQRRSSGSESRSGRSGLWASASSRGGLM